MAIRVTGMYSGLDTESIINELASAQSYKKTKLVKAQTKLSWKQDAWKALNTKIYSFYTNVLDNMRFQGSYMKKTTKVSNPSALKVITGDSAVNGVRTVKVDKLAKAAYLTGGDLTTKDGVCFTSRAKLKQLGFKGEGSISISGAGVSFDVDVNENMTIDDVLGKIKATGLNVNFDEDNQRIFVNSSNTGAINNFTIKGNDEGGMDALAALGLLSFGGAADSDEMKEYNTWAGYLDAAGNVTADYQKILDAEILERAEAYKKENDGLESDIKVFEDANKKNQEELEKLAGYDAFETRDSLYEALYGKDDTPTETPLVFDHKEGDDYVDADGKVIYKKKADGTYMDADGKGVVIDETNSKVTKYAGYYQKALDDAKADLTAAKEDGSKSEEEIKELEDKVADAQKNLDDAKSRYSYLNAIDHNANAITDCENKIKKNKDYYEVDENGKVTGSDKLAGEVKTEYDKRVDVAQKVVNGDYKDKAGATKVDGQDAVLIVNGAKFTEMTNTFTINGLTITALEETEKEVTLSTSDDTDGIYDMIKNFFSEYNKLINEMDSLYNAESSKGYEPLTSEEKDAMTDDEIEEWEKKIKESLLRKDSTLSDVADAMKTVLLQGVTVNGKQMYLSDFGINTLGYFNAAENEKNAYHIDGDKDDSTVAANEDVLKKMIASNPETVMKFFSQLSTNLYEKLGDKMSTSTASSAFTVYNDKTMKKEYNDYKDKIAKQEEKLNKLIDSWYAKFSAMETALAKLESKNSAVSNMFGN